MWKAKPGEEKWLARDSMARNQQNQDSNANVDFKAYNSLIWLLNITQCITLVVLQSLIVSDSLRPHGLQYSGLPSPSLSLGVHSNWCPLSQLCHPTISSSVVFFTYGFSSSHVWMWELDHNEGWVLKNWCFKLWCWRRLLRVPWTTRRSDQSILKEINSEYSLEGLMLKLQ